MSLCCNTVRVERVKGVGFKTRPRDPRIMGYVLSPTAFRFWVRSRCVTPVTLGRSPTSSVCEGSRDARLDVCGAGTRVILSAKSETFWCLMSIPDEPMLGNGPSMGRTERNELGKVTAAAPTVHRTLAHGFLHAQVTARAGDPWSCRAAETGMVDAR